MSTERQAQHAIFKSKTLGLIDTLKLAHDEVIGLGMTMVVAHAAAAGIGPNDLHAYLDECIKQVMVDDQLPGGRIDG